MTGDELAEALDVLDGAAEPTVSPEGVLGEAFSMLAVAGRLRAHWAPADDGEFVHRLTELAAAARASGRATAPILDIIAAQVACGGVAGGDRVTAHPSLSDADLEAMAAYLRTQMDGVCPGLDDADLAAWLDRVSKYQFDHGSPTWHGALQLANFLYMRRAGA